MRRFCLSATMLLAASGNAEAWNSPAPDVVLYTTPALADVLHRVAGAYTAQTGVEVHIFAAPPDGLLGLLKHRARDDVVVADTPTLRALADGRMVHRESVMALGNDPYVIIRNAGTAVPQRGDAMQLLGTHVTVVPDPTTASSFDGQAVLRAAAPSLAVARIVGVENTEAVLASVRHDASLLGLVHLTEAHGPGIAEAARLPVPATPTSGALVIQGQSRNAAGLLAFIASPAGAAMLRSAGLETGS